MKTVEEFLKDNPKAYLADYKKYCDTYKADIAKHAKGDYSIKDDELAIVGENEELVIGSKLNGGIPMSLKQGTGVLPNTFTETLTDMAKDYMRGKPNYTTNNNIFYKFGSNELNIGIGLIQCRINCFRKIIGSVVSTRKNEIY